MLWDLGSHLATLAHVDWEKWVGGLGRPGADNGPGVGSGWVMQGLLLPFLLLLPGSLPWP